MLIQVDFFKKTGKWYSGGRVEVNAEAYNIQGIIVEVVGNQKILMDGWWKSKEFYVVTSDIPESENDPNYRMTFLHLYDPSFIYSIMEGDF